VGRMAELPASTVAPTMVWTCSMSDRTARRPAHQLPHCAHHQPASVLVTLVQQALPLRGKGRLLEADRGYSIDSRMTSQGTTRRRLRHWTTRAELRLAIVTWIE
jgi:hypothetical protein